MTGISFTLHPLYRAFATSHPDTARKRTVIRYGEFLDGIGVPLNEASYQYVARFIGSVSQNQSTHEMYRRPLLALYNFMDRSGVVPAARHDLLDHRGSDHFGDWLTTISPENGSDAAGIISRYADYLAETETPVEASHWPEIAGFCMRHPRSDHTRIRRVLSELYEFLILQNRILNIKPLRERPEKSLPEKIEAVVADWPRPSKSVIRRYVHWLGEQGRGIEGTQWKDVERWAQSVPGHADSLLGPVKKLYIAMGLLSIRPGIARAKNPTAMTLETLPEDWIDMVEHWVFGLAIAHDTRRTQMSKVVRFLAWFAGEGKSLKDYTPEEFERWVAETPSLGRIKSLHGYKTAINSFAYFLWVKGHISSASVIPPSAHPEHATRISRAGVDLDVVNAALEQKALEFSDHWDIRKRRKHLRCHTAFVLAADCGLTSMQIVQLTPGQLSVDGRGLKMPTQQLARKITLTERAAVAIENWMAFSADLGDPIENYLFGSQFAGGKPHSSSAFGASCKKWLNLRHPTEKRLVTPYDVHLAHRRRLESAGMQPGEIAKLVGPQNKKMRERRIVRRANRQTLKSSVDANVRD